MSKRDADGQKSPAYRNPPEAHRFRKGQSGNPAGRPPRVRPKPPCGIDLSSAALDAALRLVRIRDENGVSEAPAAVAGWRQVARRGASGDVGAQRLLTQTLARQESRRRAGRVRQFEEAVRYIQLTGEIADIGWAAGSTVPRCSPDPDDIMLDVESQTARMSPASIARRQRALRDLRVLIARHKADARAIGAARELSGDGRAQDDLKRLHGLIDRLGTVMG
jgi:hypothetical protein